MHDGFEPIQQERIDGVLWESYLKRGQSALRLNNAGEAARMFEIAMEKAHAFGEGDWRTLDTQRLCALTLVQAKEYQRAETMLKGLLKSLHEKFGQNSMEVLEAMRVLAVVHEERGHFLDAAKLIYHIMQHHPRRNTSNDDFRAIQAKFCELMDKVTDRNPLSIHPSQDETDVNWLG